MMQINRNLYPRDGYFFLDSDGVRISGDSWAGVIRRVEGYRQRQGRAVGNVEAEVMAQACARNPGICVEENAAYKVEVNRASLKTRILMWFMQLVKRKASNELVFVSDQDARNRAYVCSRCQFNKPLPDGCASCRQAVKESRKNIIGGRFEDARMNACEILAEDLNTSAWLDQQAVDNGALPQHCWRKRTL